MKRISYLIFIAAATFLIILYIKRPDLFAGIKPWFLGILAPVAGIIKRLYSQAKEKVSSTVGKKALSVTEKQNNPGSKS